MAFHRAIGRVDVGTPTAARRYPRGSLERGHPRIGGVGNPWGLFFALSAVAHAGNATCWRGFYLRRLGQAQCPVRWLEYVFSAPIMILSIAYAAGVRGHVELLQGYALVATTITFGWLNEVINRPRVLETAGGAPVDAWALPLLPRLQAHLLGYVPQLAAWYGVAFTFLRSATGAGAVCGG